MPERFFPKLEQVAQWLVNNALRGELGAGGDAATEACNDITYLAEQLTHHVYTLERTLKASASSISKEVA
ncbi:hypothetical protein DI392_06095 [Vibrio albus]|uniref:Uncharacterized protein n=1 Tax=Vibrio albus TaxID=2200953 RepID=A0A2U3BD18_9VIBR|nr:hypothetical protein DI392_06095 [Vibrio albus]